MPSDSLEKIAEDLYSYLATRFPVCCSSDEFIFFPQALSSRMDWTKWDDLSPESVEDAVANLRLCRDRLGRIKRNMNPDSRVQANISLLCHITETLEEQFEFVRHYAVQPTFILMIATVGLVNALQSTEPNAFDDRMHTLPAFLNHFRKTVGKIPDLYRETGVEMAREFVLWLRSLGKGYGLKEVVEATESLMQALHSAGCSTEFRLDADLLERVVSHHMASGLSVRDCRKLLEDEIDGSLIRLESEAGHLGFGSNWQSALTGIADEKIPGGDKVRLILKEIGRLKTHCYREGFPGTGTGTAESITVKQLPASLIPVRATDSYSAIPGFPYRGGIFYVFSGGGLGQASESVHPLYRMTVAHEAYPGHHLLDMCRWNSRDTVRRPVEYPLFYEGWACFGETLMYETGAFDRKYDGLILARRRHRHAVRGKVDLLLHTGELVLERAAHELELAGFTGKRAMQTVRKYALRPGYQLCYTIGHRKFQALLKSHRNEGAGLFAAKVLEQGEILFGDLEKVLIKENV